MRILDSCLRATRRASGALAVGLVLAAPVALVHASAPPQPALNRSPAPWIGYLLLFVLLAVVVGISLIPSKRGHQD